MNPVLSVTVVVGHQRARAARCLRHLLAQTALARMEIVVVDMSHEGRTVEGGDHEAVRWMHRAQHASIGRARAAGAREARGRIVAFVEDHAYAHPRWAQAVIDAFERPVDIVSYTFTNANPERAISRMFMMVEYGRWLHPAASGFIPIGSNNNVAYRRAALEPFASRLDELFEAEYVLHQLLQSRGARPWLAADARVGHENWTTLGDGVRASSTMKRLLAAGRATNGRWSAPTRLAWAAAMSLTPPLHVARVARSLVSRPSLWPLFWMSLPLMTLVYVRSAWSEALGYLMGAGDASARFRDIEVTTTREG